MLSTGASEMPPQVPSKSRQVMAQKILQQSREAESALADALVSLPPGGVLVSVSKLYLVEFTMSTCHITSLYLNYQIEKLFFVILSYCYGVSF